MRILILGANAFSASDLIDLLLTERDGEIVGVSRSPEKSPIFLPHLRHASPRYRFVQADLNHDLSKLLAVCDEFQPEAIVNFAAQSEVAPSWDHPGDWFATNCVALAQLVKPLTSRKYLQRFVQISSPEVYGSCARAITEEVAPRPSTPYAVSKAAADMLLATFHRQFQFPVVFVRATNVYGAHQQLFKIIPRTVIAAKWGRKIALHGGGVAVKSYIHIRDVSRGTLAILEQGTIGEIYHLSPGHGVRVRDVVAQIADAMGTSLENISETAPERPGQDAAYLIDSTKARGQFDWQPTIALADGIAGVVRWIANNWSEIKNLPLDYVHRR